MHHSDMHCSLLIFVGLLASTTLVEASYTPCQTGYGFFMLLQKAFAKVEYQQTIEYRLQTECASCTLTAKLLKLMELIVLANTNQLTIVTETVDMPDVSCFNLLVTYSQSLVVDISPVLVNNTNQALSACEVDVSGVEESTESSWTLYKTCFRAYTVSCGKEDELKSVCDQVDAFVDESSLSFQKKNKTFPLCKEIIIACSTPVEEPTTPAPTTLAATSSAPRLSDSEVCVVLFELFAEKILLPPGQLKKFQYLLKLQMTKLSITEITVEFFLECFAIFLEEESELVVPEDCGCEDIDVEAILVETSFTVNNDKDDSESKKDIIEQLHIIVKKCGCTPSTPVTATNNIEVIIISIKAFFTKLNKLDCAKPYLDKCEKASLAIGTDPDWDEKVRLTVRGLIEESLSVCAEVVVVQTTVPSVTYVTEPTYCSCREMEIEIIDGFLKFLLEVFGEEIATFPEISILIQKYEVEFKKCFDEGTECYFDDEDVDVPTPTTACEQDYSCDLQLRLRSKSFRKRLDSDQIARVIAHAQTCQFYQKNHSVFGKLGGAEKCLDAMTKKWSKTLCPKSYKSGSGSGSGSGSSSGSGSGGHGSGEN